MRERLLPVTYILSRSEFVKEGFFIEIFMMELSSLCAILYAYR